MTHELHLTSASSSSSAFSLLFILLHAAPATALGHHLLFHHVDDFVGDPQVFDRASSDVAFGHPPELISILHKHTPVILKSPTLRFERIECISYPIFLYHHTEQIIYPGGADDFS